MPSNPQPLASTKTVTIYKCSTCGVSRVDRDEFEVLKEVKFRVTGYLTVIESCNNCKYKIKQPVQQELVANDQP